jgi:hypothetical protein
MPRGCLPTTRRSLQATDSTSKQANFDVSDQPLRASATMKIVRDTTRKVRGQPAAGLFKIAQLGL